MVVEVVAPSRQPSLLGGTVSFSMGLNFNRNVQMHAFMGTIVFWVTWPAEDDVDA